MTCSLEYYCQTCKDKHIGRFFKTPDSQDLDRVHEAEGRWKKTRGKFVPDDEIPSGDETNRLHRWGYTHYHEMFNARQLLGLELSARMIARTSNSRIRDALSTNLSDLLRYQNMLCRYDTMALKSLDIFSVHGFPGFRRQSLHGSSPGISVDRMKHTPPHLLRPCPLHRPAFRRFCFKHLKTRRPATDRAAARDGG